MFPEVALQTLTIEVVCVYCQRFAFFITRYRGLALKFHPSRNRDKGSSETFLQLGEAYDVLSDRK